MTMFFLFPSPIQSIEYTIPPGTNRRMLTEDLLQVGCVLQGQPIKKPEHEKLLQAGRSVQAVTKALPQVTLLTQCGFVDRAFEAITREDCPDVKRDFNRMTAAATLCALGIILASLYFCVCFRCAACSMNP
jgi:hypothetical protein